MMMRIAESFEEAFGGVAAMLFKRRGNRTDEPNSSSIGEGAKRNGQALKGLVVDPEILSPGGLFTVYASLLSPSSTCWGWQGGV